MRRQSEFTHDELCAKAKVWSRQYSVDEQQLLHLLKHVNDGRFPRPLLRDIGLGCVAVNEVEFLLYSASRCVPKEDTLTLIEKVGIGNAADGEMLVEFFNDPVYPFYSTAELLIYA